MSEALYQQAIMDLAKDDNHAGPLETSDTAATRDNPLCGDRVTMEVRKGEDGETLETVAHTVKGCALCKASAALVSQRTEGKKRKDVEAFKQSLENLLAGHVEQNPHLAIFSLARHHKSRHDCLRLPIDALLDALKD